MKHISPASAIAVALSLACVVTLAQEKPKLAGEDWVSLFNGKDLTGWIQIGHESWTVENDVIHGKGVTKDYGYLQTQKQYIDFQLSLRFKCVGDGNSGVFFHTDFKPGTADVSQGLQFEIDQVIGHTGGIYGDGRQWIAWPAPSARCVTTSPSRWGCPSRTRR